MRPTCHFVSPADLRWLLALTAPHVHKINKHTYKRVERDEVMFKKTNAVIAKSLRGGKQLTRDEALAELVGRYWTSRGPASVKDFAAWSGHGTAN